MRNYACRPSIFLRKHLRSLKLKAAFSRNSKFLFPEVRTRHLTEMRKKVGFNISMNYGE